MGFTEWLLVVGLAGGIVAAWVALNAKLAELNARIIALENKDVTNDTRIQGKANTSDLNQLRRDIDAKIMDVKNDTSWIREQIMEIIKNKKQ